MNPFETLDALGKIVMWTANGKITHKGYEAAYLRVLDESAASEYLDEFLCGEANLGFYAFIPACNSWIHESDLKIITSMFENIKRMEIN